MIATTTTATATTKMGTVANIMHANAAGAPLPLLPRRVSSSSSIASASSAASIADLISNNNNDNEDDGSSSSGSSSASSTPRKTRRVRGMRGVLPPELAIASSSPSSLDTPQAQISLPPPPQMQQADHQVPFPTSSPSISAPEAGAVPASAPPIQKSQPLLYTPGMSLMSLRLASLPRPQQSPKQHAHRPQPLPLSPPHSHSQNTSGSGSSVLSYAPASYSKPSTSTAAAYSPHAHAHTHIRVQTHAPVHPGQQRSLSSPPFATPSITPTTPLTPGGTPEVRKKCGQLVKSSLKSSRSYSSSSSMSLSSSTSSASIGGTPLPASSSGLSIYTNGSVSVSSRSEPATPTASKAVHFDNARLEFVRLFLAEQTPAAVSRDGSPTPDGDGNGEEGWRAEYDSRGGNGGGGEESGEWPGWIFGGGEERDALDHVNGEKRTSAGATRLAMHLTLAPPPGLLTDPRLVALESMRLVQASTGDEHHHREREPAAAVHGSVRVRNLAYGKAVWARFTLDGWRTTSEVCARWVESVGGSYGDAAGQLPAAIASDKMSSLAQEEEERRRRRAAEWDRFAFTIDLSGLALGDLGANGGSGKERRLELAVKYVADGREQEAMWDNNGGRNYVATFVRERVVVPVSSSNTSSSAGVGAGPKSIIAANQAYFAQQQQHLPQRRHVRRLRVQEHAVEDGSESSEESTETEARAASRRGRVMPVRAATAPASVQSHPKRPVDMRATEEERDMADLRSKLEKVAAQGHQHQHQHQNQHHHASSSPSRVGGGGGSSSSSQSSTPTTYTYNAMHHTHGMAMSSSNAKTTKGRSASPTEYAAAASARRVQSQTTAAGSPSVPLARASAIHQRTQSFPQSSWRVGQQQLAQHQHYQQHPQAMMYGDVNGGYVYPHPSSSTASFGGGRSPQQHLGSPRDVWDGEDGAAFRHGHARASERGYFDMLPQSSSQAISRSSGPITLTITGSTPPSAITAANGKTSPSSSPPAPYAYPPSSASARGVGLGMSLLSPESALSTPGMISPASTSSSSSSSEDDDDDDDHDEEIADIDTIALAGHLQHQLVMEEDVTEGMLPVSVPVKGGAAAAAAGVDEATMSAETPYRQFLNRFCFFTGPGTGAASPLNTAVSLAAGSSQAHGHTQRQDNLNAHAKAYQALPGASPPRHQRAHEHGHEHRHRHGQGHPTPSSSVETVVGLGGRV